MIFSEVKHRNRICNYGLYLQAILLLKSKVKFPLKVHGYSIDSTSVLHRYSIETMDLRWSNDGVTMEYLRKKNGKTAEFLARKADVLGVKNLERDKTKIPHCQGCLWRCGKYRVVESRKIRNYLFIKREVLTR